jgi:uncharacterized protein (DUF736 family)
VATLGKFQSDKNGDWVGRVQTSDAKRFIRITRAGHRGKVQPDYVVKKGKAEVGLAWSMVSKGEFEFLDVTFGDQLWGEPRNGILKICSCGCGADLVMLPALGRKAAN